MGFSTESFKVLEELSAHNNKAWYDASKERLNAQARAPFAEMLEAASARLAGQPGAVAGSAATMFRQFRDVRFAKDKTPYKTNVAGILTRSGSKKDPGGLVYAQISAAGGSVGAGYYKLTTAQLNAIRDAVLDAPEQFAQIERDLAAAGLDLSRASEMKSMPRGYAQHADHPSAAILRLRSFIVHRDVSVEAFIAGDGPAQIAEVAIASRSLRAFCDALIT